jgi:hypothetical protein
MTPSPMDAKNDAKGVDVLAVINGKIWATEQDMKTRAVELRAVYAAVAELMAAVRLTLATGRISENLPAALIACEPQP